jgi:uncharacterized membrane protein YphA (DoxX/SURF4 family)
MIKQDPREEATMQTWTIWLNQVPRWFVGLVLIATGTGKALDMPGFIDVLAAYDLAPDWVNVILAYTLPFIELTTGFCLLARIRLRLAAWVTVGLHVVLLSSVLITLWRGLNLDNCGCFGVFLARPLTGQTAIEDTVMLGLSLLVLREVKIDNKSN